MNKKWLKIESKELRLILNEWDFLGVLPGKGGPEDEYDDLVSMILSFMHDLNIYPNTAYPSRDMVKEFIGNKLEDHFGFPEYIKNHSDKVDLYSKKIFDWWNDNQRVQWLTSQLRSNDDPFYKTLREKLTEKGVNIKKTILAQLFSDDTAFEFGIIVTLPDTIIQFGYDYLHKNFEQGTFTEWNSIGVTGPWSEQIKIGLDLASAELRE